MFGMRRFENVQYLAHFWRKCRSPCHGQERQILLSYKQFRRTLLRTQINITQPGREQAKDTITFRLLKLIEFPRITGTGIRKELGRCGGTFASLRPFFVTGLRVLPHRAFLHQIFICIAVLLLGVLCRCEPGGKERT